MTRQQILEIQQKDLQLLIINEEKAIAGFIKRLHS